MSESHNVKKEVKGYYLVFGALLVLSALTVGASYIQVGIVLGVTIALMIAAVKGSLVASFFMHLAHECKIIYNVLIMTVIFFACMMFLIIAAYHDPLAGTVHLEEQYTPSVEETQHKGNDKIGDHH